MEETIFDKIISKEISSEIVYEDNNYLAFKDINPQAPVHILIIPKKRIPTINDLDKDDSKTIGEMTLIARDIAKLLNIDKDGYRLVFNCNEDGGQTVFHIHLHLLGGRSLSWPPG
jgi:histidine triad (HIT) family protein|tara:strand:+ start:171 stop:515 length:345 start_codon:yes stop_codon:yes gene_type:complete